MRCCSRSRTILWTKNDIFQCFNKRGTRKKFSGYALTNNPIDLTGSATIEDFMRDIRICDKTEGVNTIALSIVFQDTPLGDEFAEKLVLNRLEKPLLVFAPGGEYTRKKCRILNSNGTPTFQSTEGLVLSKVICCYVIVLYLEDIVIPNSYKILIMNPVHDRGDNQFTSCSSMGYHTDLIS